MILTKKRCVLEDIWLLSRKMCVWWRKSQLLLIAVHINFRYVRYSFTVVIIAKCVYMREGKTHCLRPFYFHQEKVYTHFFYKNHINFLLSTPSGAERIETQFLVCRCRCPQNLFEVLVCVKRKYQILIFLLSSFCQYEVTW